MLDVHCSFQYLNHADNFLVRRGLGDLQDFQTSLSFYVAGLRRSTLIGFG